MTTLFIYLFLFFLLIQNTDDLLVASAECPSDDEDLEECEPGGKNILLNLPMCFRLECFQT